ncbi:MAG: DUF6677 family protein [Pirellulaceae bacterium]|nr:hypothetical protein [Planctomycetales bacterium]
MANKSAVGYYEPVDVDLKNPVTAAFLAFLWPGAGHMYQGRYGKGLLFMICILSTFVFGYTIGGGKVVYAAFKKPDIRYAYFFQAPVGLPALPALLQSGRAARQAEPLFGGFMAPPHVPEHAQDFDELSKWHEDLGFYFELGTVYTIVAGMLNVLAIYDAAAGPMYPPPPPKDDEAPTDKSTENDDSTP